MTLDLGICNLRPWQWGDERSLARHANDREVWRNLRETYVLEGRLHRSVTKDGKTIDRLLYACIRDEQHEVYLPL